MTEIIKRLNSFRHRNDHRHLMKNRAIILQGLLKKYFIILLGRQFDLILK